MIVLLRVLAGDQLRQGTVLPEVLGVELLAEEDRLRLGKTGDPLVVQQRKAGGGDLVLVPAGDGTEVTELLAEPPGPEEGEGEALCRLGKLVGVALGPHKEEGHRLIPQTADAAPAHRHRIGAAAGGGGCQRPLLPDAPDKVFRQGLGICFNKMCHRIRLISRGAAAPTVFLYCSTVGAAAPDREKSARQRALFV